jgi:hypothetical protein
VCKIAEVDPTQETPQSPRKVIGLLRAVGGIERQRFRNDLVERKEPRVRIARSGVRSTNRGLNLRGRSAAERRLAAPELDEERGHCKDIRGRRQLLAFHLLGRHVPG